MVRDLFRLSLLLGVSLISSQLPGDGLHSDVQRINRQDRFLMVERQLTLRGIRDERVLAAMRKIERHRFVPQELQSNAYDDRALSIGFGQTISQPYVVALMTELPALQGHERVLEVGTGSGYQAAILGELVKEVHTVEIVPELAKRSAELLKELGYGNVHVHAGDGYKGWPADAPYDAIIVTCAPDHVPQPLVDQLTEGGRLIIPLGSWPQPQMLMEYQKMKGEIIKKPVIPVSFVPMTGELK
jgi:protein-L-isoaspartate(D-aspartate) O-methyltransferase